METEKKPAADEPKTHRRSPASVDAKEPESAFGLAFGTYLAVLVIGVLLLAAGYYFFAG